MKLGRARPYNRAIATISSTVRPVCVSTQVVPVGEAFREQHMHHCARQRDVWAGPRRNMQVGLICRRGALGTHAGNPARIRQRNANAGIPARVLHHVAQSIDAIALHQTHRARVETGPDRLIAMACTAHCLWDPCAATDTANNPDAACAPQSARPFRKSRQRYRRCIGHPVHGRSDPDREFQRPAHTCWCSHADKPQRRTAQHRGDGAMSFCPHPPVVVAVSAICDQGDRCSAHARRTQVA